MSNAGTLNDRSKQELVNMARRKGVRGWDGMTKDQLVKALGRAQAKTSPKPASKPAPKPAAKITKKPTPKPVTRPIARTRPASKPAAKVTKPLKPAAKRPAPPPPAPRRPLPPAPTAKPIVNGSHANGATKPVAKPVIAPKPPIAPPVVKAPLPPPPPPSPAKDLAGSARAGATVTKDRIVLMVPDPYWLRAYWELTTQSVQRAEAALKQDWHGAKPIIRLFDVTSQDTTSTSETPVRDIPIHGYGDTWYIEVTQPPRQYRADIGYVSKRGDFYVLARSNVVTPPKAGASETLETDWGGMEGKKAERVLAMSTGFETPEGDSELRRYLEEKLKRSLGGPKDTGFGSGAVPPASIKKFYFDLDAKLVVFGKTDPTAHVTLGNEPIQLGGDGTFFMSLSLPDSRQIIPAVATSADGVEERTIVLAVERNTKHLDPMIHDQMSDS